MNRRPLMYLTTAFAAGIILSYYCGVAGTFGILILFLIRILLRKRGKECVRATAWLIAAGLFFGIASFYVSDGYASALLSYQGKQAVLHAKVVQIETREGSYGAYLQIKARVMSLDGTEAEKKEKILIRYYGADDKSEGAEGSRLADVIPGDEIRTAGEISKPDGRRNPGCFDYALYLRSIGINMCMTASELTVCGGRANENISGKLYTLREAFLERLEDAAGAETAGVMRGILFGEKTDMDENTLEEFQKNGTAHVLAVSGLHVGILYGFLSFLWRWRKGTVYFASVMVFFFCYMVMASFSPSVVRAVFMVGLHALAKLTHRRYDLSSAAFLTALLMLVKNPMHVFHTGFQMSFLAVLTLSLIIPIVKKFYSGLLLGSLSVQIGLLPYTIYTFNYLSAGAVFINIPVIFLTGIIVPAGLCSMVLMHISEPIFQLCSGVIFGLCRILTSLNDMTGIDGVTVFTVGSPPLSIIALYYLALLFFVSEDGRLALMRNGKGYGAKAALLVTAAALLFGMTAGSAWRKADVVFVDVGQGDCMHIRTEQDGDYLIDGGGSISYNIGKKTLKPYLLKNGVRHLDGAFVTHLHTDHYKGIAELCREGMVNQLFLYEGCRIQEDQIIKDTGMEREAITYLYKGQIVRLGNDAEIKVLWPECGTEKEYRDRLEREEDENDSSLILLADVNGLSMLATADVDEACLDGLAEEWGKALDADILKAAHHGSKYSCSEAFAEKASPAYAVFQVGKNNFGHPDEGVVENYRGKGIIVYRNDEDGAVAFKVMKNGGIRVRTVKGESR